MAEIANGTTLTFGSQLADLKSVSVTQNGQRVEITDLDDTSNIYEVGTVNLEVQCTVGGDGTGFTIGDQDSLTVAYNSGGDHSLSDMILADVEDSGEVNGVITTTLTFVQGEATA